MQCFKSSPVLCNNVAPHSAAQYRLGDLLLEEHVISEGQLNKAIHYQEEHQNTPLGDILVTQHSISQRQLNRCLKRQNSLRAAMLSIAFCVLPAQLVAAKDLDSQPNNNWQQPTASQFESMAVSDNAARQMSMSHQVVYSMSGSLSFFSEKQQDETLGNHAQQIRKQYKVSPSQYRFNVLTDGVSLNIQYKF